MGGMLAAALFLVEAGAAQVVLARDEVCRAHEPPSRVGGGRQTMCLGDGEVAILESLSRGIDRPLTLRAADSFPWTAWLMNTILYFLLGGLCAQLRGGWGAALLIGLNVVLIALLTALRFMGPYLG